MNIELLKKLTRLANNNPNENEANLAARKVCKMLEESDFKLNETQNSSNPFDAIFVDENSLYENFIEMWRRTRAYKHYQRKESQQQYYNQYGPTIKKCKECGDNFTTSYFRIPILDDENICLVCKEKKLNKCKYCSNNCTVENLYGKFCSKCWKDFYDKLKHKMGTSYCPICQKAQVYYSYPNDKYVCPNGCKI